MAEVNATLGLIPYSTTVSMSGTLATGQDRRSDGKKKPRSAPVPINRCTHRLIIEFKWWNFPGKKGALIFLCMRCSGVMYELYSVEPHIVMVLMWCG